MFVKSKGHAPSFGRIANLNTLINYLCSMLQDFRVHIENNFEELKGNKFLIACSGGLDSVVLVHLCHESNMDFVLAHCNFGLRGEASNLDEAFVKDLSIKLNKEFYVTHFNTNSYVVDNKVSVQMAARELRYNWFNEIVSENNLKAILTAHHTDDDLETFIINLSRGSGIEGLMGIPKKTETICRPLLKYSRVDLQEYAEKNSLEWREDESNVDTKYLRNKIRHQIIPNLKELHPSFLANFKNSIAYLNQTNELAKREISKWKERYFIPAGSQIKISITELKKLQPLEAYLYGLFSGYGFREWNNVQDLLDGMSGKSVVSKTHHLLKDREYVILSEKKDATEVLPIYSIEKENKTITEPIAMSFATVEERGENRDNVIYVDKKALKYPLVIRKWNNGDYFYPLGFQGKKKLAKFFKDEKVDRFSKQEQWLLCSRDKIVWIVGRRADNRFKVLEDTTEIMKIEVKL